LVLENWPFLLRIIGTRFSDPSELVKMAPRRSEMTENNEESILKYSFSTFLVKILPIRRRLSAISKNPTSELAPPVPKKYPIIKHLYVLFSEIELRNNCPEEKPSRIRHIIAVSSARKPLKTLSNPHYMI
jgi:hypothetical protein